MRWIGKKERLSAGWGHSVSNAGCKAMERDGTQGQAKGSSEDRASAASQRVKVCASGTCLLEWCGTGMATQAGNALCISNTSHPG